MVTPENTNLTKESSPQKVENVIPIEQQANYKGNYSELIFSRLNNPVIRTQLLDLIEKNEKWIEEHPPMVTEIKRNKDTGEIIFDDSDIPIFDNVPGTYVAKSRKEIEAGIDEAMDRESKFTSIDFDKDVTDSVGTTIDRYIPGSDTLPVVDITDPRNRTVSIGVKRYTSVPLTEAEIRNISMVESHEKGHVFRVLKDSEFLEKKFSEAFDVSKINPDNYLPDRPADSTDQQVIDSAKGYLFNFKSPHEIIERMSQLKSYFGMKGDEKFTPQHLEYARKHYLEDGMMDNNMKTFFEAVTPETEFTFLKLINSVGV